MPGSLLLCWKRQRQRVAALGSQDPLRRQADRGPASAGRERDRLTRRRRRSDRSSTGVRLPEHACAQADLHRDPQRKPSPRGEKNGGLLGGERVRNDPREASARSRTTQPVGLPRALRASPAGRRPGLLGAPSVALGGRAPRSSMPPLVHAAMAWPTDQLNVLAALVPEPGVRSVVHRDRRRSATVQN